MRDTEIILVAFEVQGDSTPERHEALQRRLHPLLASQDPTSPVECWWVAQDDRTDGSDNDSAVFVKTGQQEVAAQVLVAAGLTHDYNVVRAESGQFAGLPEIDLAEALFNIQKRGLL